MFLRSRLSSTLVGLAAAVVVIAGLRAAQSLVVPFMLALFLAMLGLWAWSQEQIGRERVVLAADQETRFAPLDDAQPHFKVPPGSIVTYQETEGDWIKIAVGDKTGWLKSTVCTGVDDVPYL